MEEERNLAKFVRRWKKETTCYAEKPGVVDYDLFVNWSEERGTHRYEKKTKDLLNMKKTLW